jgi:glutathione synthase/RimK-type ligase-like ATP-grasp enzyme
MKKILVLSSAETEYTIDANNIFVQEIEKRLGDISIDTSHYRDVSLFITKDSIEAKRISSGTSLNDYDLVYFKSFYRYTEQAAAISDYLKQENVRYICHEIDQTISFSKLSQYTRLSRRHLPIIPTVFVERQMWRVGAQIITKSFGFPCVFKAIDGKGGDVNYLVKDTDELLDAASRHDCDFVAQQFIPNEYDLRVLVANGDVKRIIRRQRIDESSHLNNTSKGADATLVPPEELAESTRAIAIEAAAEFRREIAGVDIMTNSETGEIVILEVNASPQAATGAFKEEKLDTYAQLFSDLLDIDI